MRPARRQTNASGRWSELGGVSGLIFCLLWAPVGLLLPLLPDLGSPARIHHFYQHHEELLKLVALLLSIAFLFFLSFLAALTERFREDERSGPLTWMVFGSALMFMTGLSVAVGIVAAATLLSATASPLFIQALHAGAFLLAAPASAPGVAFFLAIAILSFRTGLLPKWLAWLAIPAAVANAGALAGVFSLTGALNSGNGAAGGLPAPVLAWWLWTLSASIFLIIHPSHKPSNGRLHCVL